MGEKEADRVIASATLFAGGTVDTLRALAGCIIPASASHGVPGADDDAIFADVLRSGSNVAESLTRAAALADDLAGGSFVTAGDEDRMSAAVAFCASFAVPARTLLGLLAQCYYRDDRVLRSIGLDARAPHPLGYEVEQGDWRLLDPVKARGRIYKEV